MTPLALTQDGARDSHEAVRPQIECRCPACGRVQFEYAPPIALVKIRCRKCGAWFEMTDMRETAA